MLHSSSVLLGLVATATALLPPAPKSARPPTNAITRRAAVLGATSAASILAVPPSWSTAVAASPNIFEPPAGSLSGTNVVITGANTGLGLESGKRLFAAGATVIVTARSQSKADAAASKVAASSSGANAGKVVAVDLDLADLKSVKGFPMRLQTALGGASGDPPPPVEVLLNNAGVMAIPERLETSDGFEKTVGVNHLGHFALVAALMPSLKRARGGFRVINVSSDAHRFATADAIKSALDANLDPDYAAGGWGNYGLSKAANVLFTVELQKRIEAAGLKGSAVSLHPGVVQTDLPRYIMGGVAGEDTRMSETAAPPTGLGKVVKESLLDKVVIPVEVGANTQVFLAAAADNGGDRARKPKLYFDKMKAVKPNDAAADPALAKRLWEISEKLTASPIAP
jgi:NAD(P)-dependent dehydrogenase (short-subunit alcohol dehydrogenase family)